jgi:SAM-dependent methyltransferase
MFLTPASPQYDLKRRLSRLARVFAVTPIAGETMRPEQVVAYYDQCFDAYRRHHSREGAVHMALNEGGRFEAAGFYGQLRRLEGLWGHTPPPADVLELAFGHGFNVAWLADRFRDTRFAGLDLTPRHVEHTRRLLAERGISNVALQQGDFHTLPYADASFDHVYCIEAFCYATDTPRALAEQARVLRPGGTTTLFDGYLTKPLSAMDEDEALAIRLVAKGMAIDRFQVIDELLDQARAIGLEPLRVDALDEQIMPSLARLERLTGAVVRWPWLGRRALSRRPPMRGRNVLAGYLMRCTVRCGLLAYRQFTLRKREPAPL